MSGSESIQSHSNRRATLATLILLGFGAHAQVALTQEASDPLEKCFSTSDSAARLACFDSEMHRRHAATESTHTAPSTGASLTTAPPRTADDTLGLDGRQLILKRKAENIPPGTPEPMVVTLTRLTQHPGHQYSFELANGQIWQSTDAEGDLFLGPHETVTIRAGVMGAFFLKTQNGLSIRVHRLR